MLRITWLSSDVNLSRSEYNNLNFVAKVYWVSNFKGDSFSCNCV